MLGILLNFTQEHREQYLKRIEKLNSNLHQLVNGTAAVEAHKSRKVNVARQFQRVREHATTLYGALKEKLQISSCPCEVCTVDLFSTQKHSYLFSLLTASSSG